MSVWPLILVLTYPLSVQWTTLTLKSTGIHKWLHLTPVHYGDHSVLKAVEAVSAIP